MDVATIELEHYSNMRTTFSDVRRREVRSIPVKEMAMKVQMRRLVLVAAATVLTTGLCAGVAPLKRKR